MLILRTCLLLSVLAASFAALSFSPEDPQNKCGVVPCSKNHNYDESCVAAIRAQISRELDAAITYLAAGAHFSTDGDYRAGTAEIFFDHANEEREHAFKLADYLLLRGDDNVHYLQEEYKPLKDRWTSVLEALTDALDIEKAVTRHFTDMIASCERDWHAADWLTAEMLDEQHKGVRMFTGHVTTLRKMQQHSPNLAEFMFDQELQKLH